MEIENFKIEGVVTLNHADIVKAISDYVKNKFGYPVNSIVFPDVSPKSAQALISAEGELAVAADASRKASEVKTPAVVQERIAKRAKKGSFYRPNYGIGSFLAKCVRDQLRVSAQVSFGQTFTEVRKSFPMMTRKMLKAYLMRPSMTGVQLVYPEGVITYLVVQED